MELDAHIRGFLPWLFFTLALLFGLYMLMALTVARPSLRPGLAGIWGGFGTIFLLAGLSLRRVRLPLQWVNPVFGASGLVVVASTLLLVQAEGPLFTTTLILALLGYGMLALSMETVVALVAIGLFGWFWLAAPQLDDPAWQSRGIFLVTAAVIAMLAQASRLRAYRSLIGLRQAERRAAQLRLRQAETDFRAQLVNAAAHELATPLTPILIQLDLLGRNEVTKEERLRSTAVLQRNFARLSNTLQTISLMSKAPISAEALDLTRVDLAMVFDEAAREALARQPSLADALVLGFDAPIEVTADLTGMRIVALSLVGVATRFAAQGATSRFHPHPAAPGVVMDTVCPDSVDPAQVLSPGSEEAAQNVFQADLTLAQQIVSAHNAKLRVALKPLQVVLEFPR